MTPELSEKMKNCFHVFIDDFLVSSIQSLKPKGDIKNHLNPDKTPLQRNINSKASKRKGLVSVESMSYMNKMDVKAVPMLQFSDRGVARKFIIRSDNFVQQHLELRRMKKNFLLFLL